MGELEKKVEKRIKLGKVQKALLATLYIGGMMTVALVAPNALQLLGRRGGGRKSVKVAQDKQVVKRSIDALEDRGLVAWQKQKGKTFLEITDKGKEVFRRTDPRKFYELTTSRKKREKWDDKWRIVIFDIPEHQRSVRNQIRTTLQAMGFYRLQGSVWIYPYPCEDYITLLKSDFKIGKDLLYLIVDEVENDKRLREYFSLQ